MRTIVRSVFNILKREDGVTAVECALMLALIVVICIVALGKPHPSQQTDVPVVVEAVQE